MIQAIDGFQFLVGTLKTPSGYLDRRPDLLFQFLVGTLKTEEKTGAKPLSITFQFLVGTLKTVVLRGVASR